MYCHVADGFLCIINNSKRLLKAIKGKKFRNGPHLAQTVWKQKRIDNFLVLMIEFYRHSKQFSMLPLRF